jgi:hypothetical protein
MVNLTVRCSALSEQSDVLRTTRGGYLTASLEMWKWMQEYDGDFLVLIYTANSYPAYTTMQVHEHYQKVDGVWQKVENK